MNYLTFHDEEEKQEAPDNGREENIDGVAPNGEQQQIKLDEHLKLMMARHIIMKQLNQTPHADISGNTPEGIMEMNA